jgi:sugar lactone lactonase YvrE
VAFDAGGNLYVVDSAGTRIIKIVKGGPAVVMAGNGIPGFSGDGGPAIFASLNKPTSIAVDAARNIYVADNGNSRIRRISADGIIMTLNVPQLRGVVSIVADSSGSLYISETAANRVRKIAPDGRAITIAGTGIPGARGDGGPAVSAQLSSPSGLALDAAGTLYIADTGNHRVRKVTADGTILLVAGNGSEGSSGDGSFAVLSQLRAPMSVAPDGAGNLYIADTQDSRIRKVTPAGNIATLQAQLGNVQNIAVDEGGNVYFVDPSAGRVGKISPDGTVSIVPGSMPLDH